MEIILNLVAIFLLITVPGTMYLIILNLPAKMIRYMIPGTFVLTNDNPSISIYAIVYIEWLKIVNKQLSLSGILTSLQRERFSNLTVILTVEIPVPK